MGLTYKDELPPLLSFNLPSLTVPSSLQEEAFDPILLNRLSTLEPIRGIQYKRERLALMDSEEKPGLSAAVINMEGEQDTQQHYARQAGKTTH